MAQTSVDFANSKPERRNLAILLREKKVSAAKKKVSLNVEYLGDVVNSRELCFEIRIQGMFPWLSTVVKGTICCCSGRKNIMDAVRFMIPVVFDHVLN